MEEWMAYKHTFKRHRTREVPVGDKVVGGDNPIWVQSMTTPDTYDIEATVAEIHRLEEAGCEIVRVTVPKPQDAAVLGEIRRRIHLPLICDIHFDYKMALAALDHPVDKIRINPGNIGGYDRYRQVIGPPWQHPSWVKALAFSPDGKTVVTGGGEGAWRWDMPDALAG